MMAGGKRENNKSYYLYNGQGYWTMSPRMWDGNNNKARVFYMNVNGNLDSDWGVNSIYSLRPVINLKADITISSGNGTLNNPYIVIN